MMGQWYLLGKEIDHRLKIYFKANSSTDRLLYRLLTGKVFFILIFNLFGIFPEVMAENLFWSFFIIIGLFYSWPTRGKIIEESMASQMSEFRYLDNFERTVLFLILLMFCVSVPNVSLFYNTDALKLFLDPNETVSPMLWSFLNINYIPFKTSVGMFSLAWSLHLYFYGMGIFLIALYCVLRYFFARRSSILGVFAFISSWGISKVLGNNFLEVIEGTYPLIFFWSILWSSKSSTYRSGLLTGITCAYGVMINAQYILLLPILLIGVPVLFMSEHGSWFKKRWLKYNLVGVLISIATIMGHGSVELITPTFDFLRVLNSITDIVNKKAFFFISPIGLGMMIYYFKIKKIDNINTINFNKDSFIKMIFVTVTLVVMSFVFSTIFLSPFTLMWIIVILCLFPLEWLFQSMSRVRSKRNIIFVMYILVCLLDSHFEGRVRILGKFLLDEEVFKLINQM